MDNPKIGGGIVALVVLVLLVFFLGRESVVGPTLKTLGLQKSNNVVLVERVIDGDTFVTADGETVRIIGIDAPEGKDCYAREATVALENLLNNKSVRLEKDISGVDVFGRLLRHVHIDVEDKKEDNIHVGVYMLRRGYAVTAPSRADSKYRDLLASAQDGALELEKGIWKECPEVSRENEHLRQKSTEPPSAKCNIKGNVSEKGYGRKYYYRGCPNYVKVKIDPSRGDKWFCSFEEAEKAGFEVALNCPQ